MWRERFGLDSPPLERAKRYLGNPDEWSVMFEYGFAEHFRYHTTFPEFTLRVAKAEDVVARNEEWTRGRDSYR